MKRRFSILNGILLAVNLVLMVRYRMEGGIVMKGIASAGFAVLGLVNLFYVLWRGSAGRRYPIWMALGLVLCMAADIVLNIEFIYGTVMFAGGHVCYMIAYGGLNKFGRKDLIPIGVVGLITVLVVTVTPVFNFDTALTRGIVIGYAVVISCMLGKAVGNFATKRCLVTGIILVGSCLFWFSDLMLAIEVFADGPKIVDTLCLFTYYPAQSLLAHGIYWYAEKK